MITLQKIIFASLTFGTFSLVACGGGSDEVTPLGDGDGEVNNGGDGDEMSTMESGGTAATGGTGAGATTSTGGVTTSTGGATTGTGGSSSGGWTSSGGTGTDDLSRCDDGALDWKTARKTHYTSYPDPGSEECIEYNGCMWAGWFAGCNGKQTEEWVEANNIAALFPGFDDFDGHQICIRSGDRQMIVNVVDTCDDADCSGCCSQNQADNDALVDLESFTNARWGLADGIIEWADLGPAENRACPGY